MQYLKIKNKRLEGYDYKEIGYYFITICSNEKLQIFGKIQNNKMNFSRLGYLVIESIENLHIIYDGITIDKYVVMPNHIHMIIVKDNSKEPSLSNIINQFKGNVTRNGGKNIWERSFYDHIIRNEKDYLRIAEYIENNVLKWSLDCYNN